MWLLSRDKGSIEGALEGFVLVADGSPCGDLQQMLPGLSRSQAFGDIFAVVVFFLRGRLVVEQLISGAIEADVGRERGSEHVTNIGGSLTCLQVSVEYVWCIWPEVWPEVFLRLALGELFDIL